MQVRDILRIKGNTLYTVTPETSILEAVDIMAEHDIGSLVVMDKGTLVGVVTFKEVLSNLHDNRGQLSQGVAADVMDKQPLLAEISWEVEELRRRMLERHARYLPGMAPCSWASFLFTMWQKPSWKCKLLKTKC